MVAVGLIELGKNDGPQVLIRFKICKGSSTDWVGWILGGRCLDCAANGGLGFIPMEHSHSWTTLGIQTERTERPGLLKPDGCYVAGLCVVDSDSESEDAFCGGVWSFGPERQLCGPCHGPAASAGVPLLYEGDPISISQGEGVWVPVVAASVPESEARVRAAFPCSGSPVEAAPGIWDSANGRGEVFVMGTDEFDAGLEPGSKGAEGHPAVVQTRV